MDAQLQLEEQLLARARSLPSKEVAGFSSRGDPEPFVDADAAAAFLDVERRQVLEMARRGIIPAHPLRGQGKGARNTWRFRLGEVADAIAGGVKEPVQVEQPKGTSWRHKSR